MHSVLINEDAIIVLLGSFLIYRSKCLHACFADWPHGDIIHSKYLAVVLCETFTYLNAQIVQVIPKPT